VNGREALRVAVVGLEFGAEFVPIYADHPDVAEVVIADQNSERLDRVAAEFGVERTAASLEEVLADSSIDAVHLVTGLRDHADHTVAALEAGKHVACTVPMALSFDDIRRIVEARDRAGTNYMMMETAVFTREYFFAEALVSAGRLGTIAYGRGTHFQDMTGWPAYWLGLPPLFYATHAISPILRLLGTGAKSVRALGGGTLDPENRGDYGNVFPVESALVRLHDSDAIVELTRSLFQLARPYTESFSLYGDRMAFEWPQLEAEEGPLVFTLGEKPDDARGRELTAERVTVPDAAERLPEAIRRYTREFVYGDGSHKSFIQGGGHSGSHPHLVHEFVSSIVEGRPSVVDERIAANWTATGIAAHRSAQSGGDEVVVPTF
jgi:predicted dehydrogenase